MSEALKQSIVEDSPELSLSGRRWQMASPVDREVERIKQSYGKSDIVARILAGRDIPDLETYLNPTLKALLPDPGLLKDMDKAVERILAAINNREKIALFGDYDVDGATSTALLYRYLKHAGGDVQFYIPDRMREGYGPNAQAFDQFIVDGVTVVITLDCGTTAFEPLAYAQSKGLDVIVIDHHAAEARHPPCVALINPNRLDEITDAAEALRRCAAVGMAFLVVVALNRALRGQPGYTEPNLLDYLDLVALGTVCDVMPLQGLNRAFVTQGLKVMAKRQNKGLAALCDIGGIEEKPSAYHLGFVLGPRINAGGRVGDASLGAQLLTSEDSIEIQEKAQKLNQYNAERKQIEIDVLEAALLQASRQEDRASVVVAGEGWHEGVIGIAAGRIKDETHKPTCVITIDGDKAKGSSRSISGFDLGAFVHRMRHEGVLTAGGGHAMAAGFSLDPARIPDFHEALDQAVLKACETTDFTPIIKIDGHLTLGAVTPTLALDIESLGPYGMGNPAPKFLFQGVIVTHAQLVGENHLRCTLNQMGGGTLQVMAFRACGTPLGDLLQSRDRYPLDIVGTLKVDRWGGNLRAQMTIEDIRKASL